MFRPYLSAAVTVRTPIKILILTFYPSNLPIKNCFYSLVDGCKILPFGDSMLQNLRWSSYSTSFSSLLTYFLYSAAASPADSPSGSPESSNTIPSGTNCFILCSIACKIVMINQTLTYADHILGLRSSVLSMNLKK